MVSDEDVKLWKRKRDTIISVKITIIQKQDRTFNLILIRLLFIIVKATWMSASLLELRI